jgi:hypothetical protein
MAEMAESAELGGLPATKDTPDAVRVPDARELDIQPGKSATPKAPLTEDEAVEHVRKGGDVIAKNRDMARRIAERAGRGKPEYDDPHGPLQKPHFHPVGPGGGVRLPGHVLF